MDDEETKQFMAQPDGTYLITGDMIIGDVVAAFPKAAGVMLGHGLHCVGCHANAFDTIEDGARGHGMPDEEVHEMIAEINELVNKRIELVELTPGAILKVKEMRAQEQGKLDWPLRISCTDSGCCKLGYEMDFDQEKPGDVSLLFGDLKVIVDEKSIPLLRGSSVDYVESLRGSGFRIENPNAKRACACSGE